MNHRILQLCLLILLTCLAACAQRGEVVKDRKEIKQCMALCRQEAITCKKVCRNNCPQCHAYVKYRAAREYSSYVHQTTVEGGIVARELNSYKDPLKCRKTTCNCPADYQVCAQQCGGKIHKVLSVTPVCD